MKKLLCAIGLVLSTAVLVSCGGGGGGGGAAEPPKTIRVTVTAQDTQLPSNRGLFAPSTNSQYSTVITARVTQASGAAVADGTSVTFSVSPSNMGRVSDPNTPTEEFNSVTVNTSGGNAEVFFNTQDSTGNVTVTASAQDPNSNQSASDSVEIGVEEGPEPEPR